jgi:PhnB protein
MKHVNPYLNFPGNTEEAFNFYKGIFGGDFLALMRFKDTPAAGEVPAEAGNGVMHVALKLGDSILMATDVVESMGQTVTVGNNVSLAIEADSREEADKIFKGLSEGGSNVMPLADQFWGAYWGALRDKYGICWMVSHTTQPAY